MLTAFSVSDSNLAQLVLNVDCKIFQKKCLKNRMHHTPHSALMQAANGVGAKTDNILLVIDEYRGLSWR